MLRSLDLKFEDAIKTAQIGASSCRAKFVAISTAVGFLGRFRKNRKNEWLSFPELRSPALNAEPALSVSWFAANAGSRAIESRPPHSY